MQRAPDNTAADPRLQRERCAVFGPRPWRRPRPVQWLMRLAALRRARALDAAGFLRHTDDRVLAGWVPLDADPLVDSLLNRWERGPARGPAAAVVIPLAGADPRACVATLESALQQDAGLREVWLCGPPRGPAARLARRVLPLLHPCIRSAGSLPAICRRTRADLLLVARPGIRLAPSAARHYEATAAARPLADLFYADSDTYDPASGHRAVPVLRPAWSPETLCTLDILGPCLCLRRSLAGRIDRPPAALPLPALGLAAARLGAAGCRIPAFLAHEAGAGVPALDACVREHLARSDLHGLRVARRADGSVAAHWHTPLPAVTIVIPDRLGSFPRLRATVDALCRITAPGSWRLTVLRRRAPPERLRRWAATLAPTVSLRVDPDAPGWYAAMNAAAAAADAEAVLFLDPGIVPAEPDWLEALCRWLALPGVQAAGPMILAPGGTIRTAGLEAGPDLLQQDRFADCRPDAPVGTGPGPAHPANVPALAERALLVRRAFFLEQGGFDPALQEQYGDWLLGSRLRQGGGRLVFDADVRLQQAVHVVQHGHADLLAAAARLEFLSDEDAGFFHPRAAGAAASRRLLAPGEATDPAQRRRQAAAIRSGCRPGDLFDLFDDAAVLAFAARNGLVFAPPAATAADAARDAGGAAAFLLTAWRGDPALRARFPRALRDGADGPFGRWLAGEGAGRLGLEPDARAHLLQARDNRPGDAVRHLFHWRWDLRFYFPLALTRWGRAGLVRWLKTFGANLGIDDTATWWFLLEAEADAGAALEVTYRLMPEWQRLHPEALGAGRAAWGRWLNATYGIPADAPGETGPAEPARRDGVNLVAHLCMPCGVQAVATACCRALRAAGRPVALRDAPLRAAGDPPDRRDYLDTERHPVSVTMLHPFFPVTEWYGTAALHPAPDAYRVGYWYWEFPEVPAAWIRHARDYDEAWAPSRFIENAFRAAFDIPVHYLPAGHAIDFEPLPRRAFDLPDDRYLFLFVYDPGSGADRKNAEALIDAYRLAVRPDDRAQLVLKTTRGHDYPGRMHALARRADGLDVRFLDCTLSRSRTLALINAADCYVSLHRSEGSGLSIAEAMMMGKPAIATGYSGNMDFMTPDNSLLVGYRPVALEHDQPPYRAGWTWAEPDIEHAAAHMRTVLDERERAAALAERGRQDTLAHFDMTAYARRLDARLQAIGAMGLLPADTRCRAHSI